MYAHLSKQQRHSSFQTRLASKLVAVAFLLKQAFPVGLNSSILFMHFWFVEQTKEVSRWTLPSLLLQLINTADP